MNIIPTKILLILLFLKNISIEICENQILKLFINFLFSFYFLKILYFLEALLKLNY